MRPWPGQHAVRAIVVSVPTHWSPSAPSRFADGILRSTSRLHTRREQHLSPIGTPPYHLNPSLLFAASAPSARLAKLVGTERGKVLRRAAAPLKQAGLPRGRFSFSSLAPNKLRPVGSAPTDIPSYPPTVTRSSRRPTAGCSGTRSRKFPLSNRDAVGQNF
ncbi:hypothetical protein BDW68DRAFT_171520 [Aspergillus falconensis]